MGDRTEEVLAGVFQVALPLEAALEPLHHVVEGRGELADLVVRLDGHSRVEAPGVDLANCADESAHHASGWLGRRVRHEDGHAHREDHQPGEQVEVVLRKEHEHGDEPDVGEGEHRYEGRYDDEPASDRARPGRQSELRDGHAEPDGDPARQEEEQGQYDQIAGGRIEQNDRDGQYDRQKYQQCCDRLHGVFRECGHGLFLELVADAPYRLDVSRLQRIGLQLGPKTSDVDGDGRVVGRIGVVPHLVHELRPREDVVGM